jgi:tetratricopeptide (TPR) repeat protein
MKWLETQFDTDAHVVDRLSVHRWVVASALAAVLCSVLPETANADDSSELEKALSAYVAHRYGDAAERLRTLLDARTGSLKSPYDIADARMYLGAVLVAQGKKEAADSVFEELLLSKPDYQPDPLRVSLEAIDAFIDTRSRLHDRLGALQADLVRQEKEQRAHEEALHKQRLQRLVILEQLASEETVIQKNSRWVGLLPFGVGQFQNGQDGLGVAFLAGESLLALSSAVAHVLSLYCEGQTNDAVERNDGTAGAYNRRAQAEALAGNLFATGFFASAIAGIALAELTFVPQRQHVEHRPIPQPPHVSLSPTVGPGGIGLVGRF